MRRFLPLALVLPILLGTPLSASDVRVVEPQEGDVLPLTAYVSTLDNGLEVIVVPTGFPNLVSVQIPVQTGSRNEVEAGKSGFAHFFEHMMFRGTPNFSTEDYDALMTRAGARRNAYTGDDLTNYHATFAKEDLEAVLEVEADRFQNLAYSLEGFKTEARAILGEYNKNSANPIQKLIEVQRNSAFEIHPYKHTTMGFIEDIEDMPNEFDYSRSFFERWYRPRNAAVVIVGDVVPDEVFPLVEKYWGPWKAGEDTTISIPSEPPSNHSVYEHVEWPTAGQPWVAVAFHGPAASTVETDSAALDMLFDLQFGETSELYKRLVEDEQIVDQFFPYVPSSKDPSLVTVFARVKEDSDVLTVRDAILTTLATARTRPVEAQRLADAKANSRNGFVRTLDNTGRIAGTLARFVSYERSFDTLNDTYRIYDSLTPELLQAAAQRYFIDSGLVVTTLSHEPLEEGISQLPLLDSMVTVPTLPEGLRFVEQPAELPLIDFKLLFTVGSAYDPAGKEGLSSLAAAMISEAGSSNRTIAEINKSLFPLAASFNSQVDKEMTTFTGVVPQSQWRQFLDIALPMLTSPGFRSEDFERLKAQQLTALTQDLRSENEEELGKEALQANLFADTPYAHPVLGTVAGIESITLEDVRSFVAAAYTRSRLSVGISGGYDETFKLELGSRLGALPVESTLAKVAKPVGRRPTGLEVQILAKETRATAISLGHPLTITRADDDFAALWLARAFLGEHRSSMSHLYQRIRHVRGMNYGDYAYIEAFPRGMYQFFPDPNIGRQAQIFEIWIRPVVPENAHMALRIALHELERFIANGLTEEDFQATRDYLMKNVYVMTSTQDQNLGYALDSEWYGIGEFTSTMRERLSKLTVDDVNRAIRQHLSAENLAIVMIAKDASGLRDALLADQSSPIAYDAEKPAEVLAEDEIIGARKLNLEPGDVVVTPIDEVFAD
jgi:zinc protease